MESEEHTIMETKRTEKEKKKKELRKKKQLYQSNNMKPHKRI